jgi:ribosome-associated translation inhibitor RaiA
MADLKTVEEMPFTKVVREAEEAAAKQQAEAEAKAQEIPGWVRDTPPAQEKMSEAPLIKLMVEQEAAVARDYAEGRITEADYQSFREMSETKIEEFRTHLEETGQDIGESFKEWAPGAKDAFADLQAKHPDLINELESGHPNLGVVADTLDTVQVVVEPLIEKSLDGADQLVEVIGTDLPNMAQDFVDARANMEGADKAEVADAQTRLDGVTTEWNEKIEAADVAIDAAREKLEADFDAFETVVDDMHAKAEADPDAEVIMQIHEADLDEEIEEETGVADA